jgi:hypothetical protein
MYGTIMRARVKAGQREALESLLMGWPDHRGEPDAYHSSELAWEDKDPERLVLAVHFLDKASYVANAESPEQNAEYRRMLELLDGEPEWIDVNYVAYQGKGLPA